MRPERTVTIVGGGIIGLFSAYFAHLQAKENNGTVAVTIYDASPDNTTAAHLFPSLSWNEMLSVVPPGKQLIQGLQYRFNAGGLRVDNPPGINDSINAQKYIRAVEAFGTDETRPKKLATLLEELGQYGMLFWKRFYETADSELKAILEKSNFVPCALPHEPRAFRALRDGYRVELFWDIPGVEKTQQDNIAHYHALGYSNTQFLSPQELISLDSSFTDFYNSNSEIDTSGARKWKANTVVLWRAGGCINTGVFLPLFKKYLEKIMGTYIGNEGIEENCFRVIKGVVTSVGTYSPNNTMVICPGKSINTLQQLGFARPPCAIFAGSSLKLTIKLNDARLSFEHAAYLNNFRINFALRTTGGATSVSQAGVVDDTFFIGIAGTKAFYGEREPKVDDEFVIDRNVLQLNMLNKAFPKIMSIFLGEDTINRTLTGEHLSQLEKTGQAVRSACARAVTYDGAPTIGDASDLNGNKIIISADFSSGGISNALLAAALTMRCRLFNVPSELEKRARFSADPRRNPLNMAKL